MHLTIDINGPETVGQIIREIGTILGDIAMGIRRGEIGYLGGRGCGPELIKWRLDENPEDVCPSCGNTLAYFAGPGEGECGRLCLTPGCDIENVELEDDDSDGSPQTLLG